MIDIGLNALRHLLHARLFFAVDLNRMDADAHLSHRAIKLMQHAPHDV